MCRRWGRARGLRSDARGERGSLRGGGFLRASSLLLGGVSRGFRRRRLGFGFGGRGRRVGRRFGRARRLAIGRLARFGLLAGTRGLRLRALPHGFLLRRLGLCRLSLGSLRRERRLRSLFLGSGSLGRLGRLDRRERLDGGLDFLSLVRGLREPSGEREDLVAHGRAERSPVRIRLRRLGAHLVHLRLGRVERGDRGVRAIQALERGIRGCRLRGGRRVEGESAARVERVESRGGDVGKERGG